MEYLLPLLPPSSPSSVLILVTLGDSPPSLPVTSHFNMVNVNVQDLILTTISYDRQSLVFIIYKNVHVHLLMSHQQLSCNIVSTPGGQDYPSVS